MTDETTTDKGLPADGVIEEHIDDALSSRYLAYALSTICLLYTSPSPRDS